MRQVQGTRGSRGLGVLINNAAVNAERSGSVGKMDNLRIMLEVNVEVLSGRVLNSTCQAGKMQQRCIRMTGLKFHSDRLLLGSMCIELEMASCTIIRIKPYRKTHVSRFLNFFKL